MLTLIPLWGCGRADVSPLAYDYTMALYSITNRQAADKLQEVELQIDQAASNGKLNDTDVKALNRILKKASDGDWKQANRECRELMEAQIE